MIKFFNRAKGVKGEWQASKYLIDKGYKILEQNYSCSLGEIDIIATLQDYIVFVEVKERDSASYGYPSESVNHKKQSKIRNVASYYLKTHKLYEIPCRFDVIEVLAGEVNHIENAF